MAGFVVDRAEHVASSCAVGAGVPGFDLFEDGQGEMTAVGPVVVVEELELQRPEEALDHAVVEAVTHGAHGAEQTTRS